MTFAVHNTERGELSETDSMSGALLAAWTHLTEDGERPPLVITDDGRPVAVLNWMPVGAETLARFSIEEKERT